MWWVVGGKAMIMSNPTLVEVEVVNENTIPSALNIQIVKKPYRVTLFKALSTTHQPLHLICSIVIIYTLIGSSLFAVLAYPVVVVC